MHFRVFSEGRGTAWGYLFGLLKLQIFFEGVRNSWGEG